MTTPIHEKSCHRLHIFLIQSKTTQLQQLSKWNKWMVNGIFNCRFLCHTRSLVNSFHR